MAEYIEKESFIEDIKTEIINLKMDGMKGTPRPCEELYGFIDRINVQPIADVSPVQHGKWIWKQGVCEDEYLRICSCCKHECHSYYDDEEGMTIYMPSNYCPNCGAKMDEV